MEYFEVGDIINNTNLEQELLQKGVSANHILYLKNKKPKYFIDHYEYYDNVKEKDKKKELVKTENVIGIFRANADYSLYDNAAGRCASDLHIYRMATAIEHIKTDTLAQLRSWYSDYVEPVDLDYFSDEDVYIVGNDGNHRSLYANIVGAPFILADIRYYKRNEEKYKAHLYLKELYNIYQIVEKDNHSNPHCFDQISFKYENEAYSVIGYINPRKTMCNEDVKYLENQLCSDWKFLKHEKFTAFLGRSYKITDLFLKFFCKSNNQRQRLQQHIDRRSAINHRVFLLNNDNTQKTTN